MAQVKAHEVEKYLKKPDRAHRVFLVYGPDAGLVSERAAQLAKISGADLSDPFSNIRLDADDVAADVSRLADEAHTPSMFGGDRLVWLKGSTQKNLIKAVEPVLDLPPQDAMVIIEAGNLKKTAALRTRIEKSRAAIALPCFGDQAQALDQIIEEELKLSKLSMAAEARSILKTLLGGDRLASRGEVQKLCLYCAGNETIGLDDISAIVGDASALAIDTVVDAASTGDIATMEHTYKRLLAQGTSVVQLVGAAQRHFQTLHIAKCGMESNRDSIENALRRFRPPVNFQRKNLVSRALTIWRLPALTRVLDRLEKVSLQSRANADMAPALVATAFLAIAIEASRAGR